MSAHIVKGGHKFHTGCIVNVGRLGVSGYEISLISAFAALRSDVAKPSVNRS